MNFKKSLLSGAGGLGVFAQASGLDLAADFNGGHAMAAKVGMARARQADREVKLDALTEQLKALSDTSEAENVA